MLKEVLIFILASIALVKGAQWAVKSVAKLAGFLRLSEFVTSFILVAGVSSLPETFIGVISTLKGDPGLGLGTILGGNIADMTLILGLVALAGNSIKIKSTIIRRDLYFAGLLILPTILGLIGGVISRIDGVILLSAGIIFMITLLREKQYFHAPKHKKDHWMKNTTIFILSIAVMLFGAHYVFTSTHSLATQIGVPSFIIGLVLVALGTTLPEFTFSLQSVRSKHAEMAIGDLLGSVVVDACIVLGILALIAPITVNVFLLSIVGLFTLFAVGFALLFMRTDNLLSKNEAMALILFYVAFIIIQILLS